MNYLAALPTLWMLPADVATEGDIDESGGRSIPLPSRRRCAPPAPAPPPHIFSRRHSEQMAAGEETPATMSTICRSNTCNSESERETAQAEGRHGLTMAMM